MKKTLYLKFVLAYIIFSVFGVIIITTFIPTLTQEHLVKEKAGELYEDATLIATTYAEKLYRNETTLPVFLSLMIPFHRLFCFT